MFKALLSTSLIFAAGSASAQTAQDYFHRGAQYYIFDQKQKATNEIYSGLRLFPSDPQLNELASLLKKEQEQQQQQQQQKQQEQQNDSSKQNQDQKQQQQSQQDKKQEEQNASEQKQQQQKDKQQQEAAKQSQDQKPPPSPNSEEQQNLGGDETNQQQYAEGQMTPDQAKQLLDSQKGEEKLLQAKPEGERRRRLKDW